MRAGARHGSITGSLSVNCHYMSSSAVVHLKPWPVTSTTIYLHEVGHQPARLRRPFGSMKGQNICFRTRHPFTVTLRVVVIMRARRLAAGA